jgi:HAMP domain-containing protein
LPDNEPRHAAWLVSFLALGVAAMLRVWSGLTVLGPLRALAAAADRLAAGDVRSVITAMRHDEIGSIAICLELCRQVLVDGPARFGGTTRYASTAPEE